MIERRSDAPDVTLPCGLGYLQIELTPCRGHSTSSKSKAFTLILENALEALHKSHKASLITVLIDTVTITTMLIITSEMGFRNEPLRVVLAGSRHRVQDDRVGLQTSRVDGVEERERQGPLRSFPFTRYEYVKPLLELLL